MAFAAIHGYGEKDQIVRSSRECWLPREKDLSSASTNKGGAKAETLGTPYLMQKE